jgi:hypothetical protein
VAPRTGLDDVEERKFLTLPGLELRPLRRPARSQSLYRLRYPGSYLISLRYILILSSILCVGFPSDLFRRSDQNSALITHYSFVIPPTHLKPPPFHHPDEISLRVHIKKLLIA